MKADILVACDFAADYGGKLTLVGTFNRVDVPELPAVLTSLGVAFRVVFEPGEDFAPGDSATLSLQSPSGGTVLRVKGTASPVTPPAGLPTDADRVVQNALNIAGVQFTEYGRYALELEVGSKKIASTAIYVWGGSK